jgi:hypothetical protein
MKKLLSGGLFLALVGFAFVGCDKEQIFDDELNQMQRKSNAVVYANLSCTTRDGKDGCQCTITQSDDDCDMPTECVSESYLPNYREALNAMFTEEEIQYRTNNKVRITEPELIEALKKDNFPIKK